MPEVHFTIQLPDGVRKHCYSPSTVVCSYFKKDEELPLADFISRSRRALNEASERVRARYGFACSSASAQLAEIEELAETFPSGGSVRILNI